MGIKTVPHLPNSQDLAPYDFCLFPKLRGCRYETIEEMKEAVMKVIDTLTQEGFQQVHCSQTYRMHLVYIIDKYIFIIPAIMCV